MDRKQHYKLGQYGERLPLIPLKTCPCCGGEAEFLCGFSTYVARCSKCGLVITGLDGERVCRKWNKRVKPDKENEKA